MTGALNVSGKELCTSIGIAYSGQILQALRELELVSFFKVGKKYMYPTEDVKIVSDKLRNGEISIKTNDGYYIIINN
jgi:hypothetical protein